MAHLEGIWIYPIKGLDGISLETARLTEAGTLAGDREYAMVDPDGRALNGKQLDGLHELSTTFDPQTERLTVSTAETGDSHRFDLATELDAAGEWLSEFTEEPLKLRRREPPAFVDRPSLGPSVISTETLETVASWFDGVTAEGARRRLRPNLVIGGVPAFWEDRFLADSPSSFEIGDVRFEGAKACARCVIPTRDPDTGEPIDGFQRRFVERRKATLPAWVDEGSLQHFYTVMVITRVSSTHDGTSIGVGDAVSAAGELDA